MLWVARLSSNLSSNLITRPFGGSGVRKHSGSNGVAGYGHVVRYTTEANSLNTLR